MRYDGLSILRREFYDEMTFRQISGQCMTPTTEEAMKNMGLCRYNFFTTAGVPAFEYFLDDSGVLALVVLGLSFILP